jgi:hypothetical protein
VRMFGVLRHMLDSTQSSTTSSATQRNLLNDLGRVSAVYEQVSPHGYQGPSTNLRSHGAARSRNANRRRGSQRSIGRSLYEELLAAQNPFVREIGHFQFPSSRDEYQEWRGVFQPLLQQRYGDNLGSQVMGQVPETYEVGFANELG